MPSGPYQKPLKRFVECLDRLEKDQRYTLHQVSEKCNLNEQTVDSYVYQNLNELNKYMIEKGKKVKQAKIPKEIRGLVVDPPSKNSAGKLFILLGLASLFVLRGLAADRSRFTCGNCGTQIDVTGWNKPILQCPRCREVYVRQPQPQT